MTYKLDKIPAMSYVNVSNKITTNQVY